MKHATGIIDGTLISSVVGLRMVKIYISYSALHVTVMPTHHCLNLLTLKSLNGIPSAICWHY